MRNQFVKVIFASITALSLCSSVALAQGRGGRGGRGPKDGFVAAGVPAMPDPPGPAPKHDLTGVWVGPIKVEMGPYPAMTPAGQAAFKQNHPIARASDNATTWCQTMTPSRFAIRSAFRATF